MSFSLFGQKGSEREPVKRDLSPEEIELLGFAVVNGVSDAMTQWDRNQARELTAFYRDLRGQTQRTATYPSLDPARNTRAITFDGPEQELVSGALASLLDQARSPLAMIPNRVDLQIKRKLPIGHLTIGLGARYSGGNLGEDLEQLQAKLDFNGGSPASE